MKNKLWEVILIWTVGYDSSIIKEKWEEKYIK